MFFVLFLFVLYVVQILFLLVLLIVHTVIAVDIRNLKHFLRIRLEIDSAKSWLIVLPITVVVYVGPK